MGGVDIQTGEKTYKDSPQRAQGLTEKGAKRLEEGTHHGDTERVDVFTLKTRFWHADRKSWDLNLSQPCLGSRNELRLPI